TGFIVLLSSVLISKYQRIQESVLLSTLGASKRQILMITALEYFFFGALASIAGIVIALVSSWGLAVFSLEIPFRPSMLVILVLFLCVTLLSVVIGLFNINRVLRTPPLAVLRR